VAQLIPVLAVLVMLVLAVLVMLVLAVAGIVLVFASKYRRWL
jgi:hypothetical protein